MTQKIFTQSLRIFSISRSISHFFLLLISGTDCLLPLAFCCFQVSESYQYNECERTQRWILFFPITHVSCEGDADQFSHPSGTILILFLQIYHSIKALEISESFCHHLCKPFWNTVSITSNPIPVKKVDVVGGGVEYIGPLKLMQASDPARNWQLYSNWADSVRSFPKVTKKKVRENKTSSLNLMLDLLYVHFSLSPHQTT